MSFGGLFAKKSIKTKLMVAMVAAGIVPLVISAVAITKLSGDALEKQTLSQLESLTSAKKRQVEGYFQTIDSQVKTLANDVMVREAMADFRIGFSQLSEFVPDMEAGRQRLKQYYVNEFGKKLEQQTGSVGQAEQLMPGEAPNLAAQILYIGDNPSALGEKNHLMASPDGSSYSDAHIKYHPVLNDYLEKFGYYDIFLVEPVNGDVIYTVFKELDYATSLETGPYRDTAIAEVYRKAKALNQGESAIVDFKPYLPSYMSPAAFIGSPVYDAGRVIGVLIFQLPADRINSMMQQKEGLGETGETYLAGADGLMRSQSRFTNETTLLKQQVQTEGLESLAAASFTIGRYTDYHDELVLGAYSRLDLSGLDWRIAAEVDVEEALAAISDIRLSNLALVATCIPLISWGALSFSGRITRRINIAGNVADRIADGKLDNDIKVVDGDEVDNLGKSLYRMQTELFGQMREKEMSMNRIKVALDNANANVMVADNDGTIIYMNASVSRLMTGIESNIRSVLPQFSANNLMGRSIDDFYKSPSRQRGIISGLTKPHVAEINVGGRILNLSVTPIIDTGGQRLGTVTEWQDLTDQRNAERDVQEIITNASAGRLSARLDLNLYNGFFRTLAAGLNQTLEAVEKPLKETRRVMERFADGDLTERVSGKYEGEFLALEEAVNTSATRLAESMTQLTGSVSALSELSSTLANDNADLRERTTRQASELQETAAAMEEITGTVEQNTDNARIANDLSSDAVKQAETGNKVVFAAIESIRQMNQSSEEIASITEIINEIAFQTNLLALNAAVEAARAGDQGRGFAVVASEVRALAQRSAEAARQIETLIRASIEKVERGSELVHRTGDSLQSIVQSISKVSSVVSEIASASNEQSIGITEINRALVSLESVTQNNLALVNKIAGVSLELDNQSADISQAVAMFKVEKQRQQAPGARRRQAEFADA